MNYYSNGRPVLDNAFANAARVDSTHTYTENGAQALKTTSDARLDLFAVIGALRSADDNRLISLFENAYAVDPLFTTKILFYARDIRSGLGERETFRRLLKHIATRHPEALVDNLDLIGVYGRYDDLYSLIDTPLEEEMWSAMKKQWNADILAMKRGEAVSLLGKWVKTADASSEKTRKLGILTAQKLGLSVYDYKRQYRSLRKHIGVVEQLMSQNRWDEIKYPEVPSRAMTLYRDAFKRHDEERFAGYLEKVTSGEEKIHAGALYPYDLVRKYLDADPWTGYGIARDLDPVVEAQWEQMKKDYGETLESAIVISDTSGSMFCDNNMPIASSLALGLLFASCNQGPYHNLFMEFSSRSDFIQVKGVTLLDQLRNMMQDAHWGQSTNLESAFHKILELAVENDIRPEDMPKALIVISDMEIDAGTWGNSWSFHDGMTQQFAQYGYSMPTVVYWNVNSRHDVYHADSDRPGCVLVSGHSASSFKQVLKCVNMTPVEAMEEIINSERYQPVTIGVAPRSGCFTWGE